MESIGFLTVGLLKKSAPEKMQLKLKDGAAVDPESGLSLI